MKTPKRTNPRNKPARPEPRKPATFLSPGVAAAEGDDLGAALDTIVRAHQLAGHRVEAVVEKTPTPTSGALAVELDYVRRTVIHWLIEIFELPTEYVLPGTWKTSRAAVTAALPAEWLGRPLSTHQRDAISLAYYVIERERFAR